MACRTLQAVPLKFVPLPGLYFLFLAAATLAYLLLVEVVKRRLMGRWLGKEQITGG